jgi:8-oxo-dGTP diphosphatase
VADEADHEHRVVAGLLRRQGRVLLCHRTPQRHWYPDALDVPGGHVEGQEEPEQALVRELWEELGVVVTPPAVGPIAHVQGSDFRMDVWAIDDWTGQSCNQDLSEHDALTWVDVQQAQKLQLADPRLLRLIEAVLA